MEARPRTAAEALAPPAAPSGLGNPPVGGTRSPCHRAPPRNPLPLPWHLFTSCVLRYLDPASLGRLASACRFLHLEMEKVCRERAFAEYAIHQDGCTCREESSPHAGLLRAVEEQLPSLHTWPRRYAFLRFLEEQLIADHKIDFGSAPLVSPNRLPPLRCTAWDFARDDRVQVVAHCTRVHTSTRDDFGIYRLADDSFRYLSTLTYHDSSDTLRNSLVTLPSFAQLCDLLIERGALGYPHKELIELRLYTRQHLLRFMAALPFASLQHASRHGCHNSLAGRRTTMERALARVLCRRVNAVVVAADGTESHTPGFVLPCVTAGTLRSLLIEAHKREAPSDAKLTCALTLANGRPARRMLCNLDAGATLRIQLTREAPQWKAQIRH